MGGSNCWSITPGFHVDVKMAEMKDGNPKLKVAFVGPPVTVEPEKRCATRPPTSWSAASSTTRSSLRHWDPPERWA
jgi:hypothetical protein